MEITTELRNRLYNDYKVYYSEHLRAWTRTQGKWNKKENELGIVTELITGENILQKGESYVEYQESGEPGHICVCGCPMCERLYRLYHKETDICFMVGSICIEKAGHPDFISDLKCGKTNGFCKYCDKPLRFRGPKKNSHKNYKGTCSSCRKFGRIYLNIPYRDKDKYRQFGTKWEPDFKLWYWIGYEDKLPKELESLKRSI